MIGRFDLTCSSIKCLSIWKRFTARPRFVPSRTQPVVIYRSIPVHFQSLWQFSSKFLIQSCYFVADINAILQGSRNEEELRHVWTQWRDVTGKPMKKLYERFVELSNEAAKLNGSKRQTSQCILISLLASTHISCICYPR